MEGALLRALAEAAELNFTKESEAAQVLDYRGGSRTDRGVSALANVVAIGWPSPGGGEGPEALLGRASQTLASLGRPLWLTGWAVAPADFNPRHALSRTYRYLLEAEGLEVEAVKAAARVLEGEHDFATFCRAEGRTPQLKLEQVNVAAKERWLEVTFSAPYFRWQLVRRLVAALEAVGRGRASLEELKAALDNSDPRGGWGAAVASGLTLIGVDYGAQLEWQPGPGLAMAQGWAASVLPEVRWQQEFALRVGEPRGHPSVKKL